MLFPRGGGARDKSGPVKEPFRCLCLDGEDRGEGLSSGHGLPFREESFTGSDGLLEGSLVSVGSGNVCDRSDRDLESSPNGGGPNPPYPFARGALGAGSPDFELFELEVEDLL